MFFMKPFRSRDLQRGSLPLLLQGGGLVDWRVQEEEEEEEEEEEKKRATSPFQIIHGDLVRATYRHMLPMTPPAK
jgi:hypothetical protein